MSFVLPPLPYAYDALEPYISQQTMHVHHLEHHANYVRKLNEALKQVENAPTELFALIAMISAYPADVRNNAGGHLNHSMFWEWLSPPGQGGEPSLELITRLESSFGSFVEFKQAFERAAQQLFGSGWVWLCKNLYGELRIYTTPNQDNPLMDVSPVRGVPLLGLDLWEHAYYLSYQNKKMDYCQAFWSLVNWNKVNACYAVAE